MKSFTMYQYFPRGLLLFVALFSFSRGAQNEAAGKFSEKIVCEADATQSYALYVPSNYDAAKLWPVIYCFDPGARGRAPVERLQAAAEKFGYIVAGSNNSRNGLWAPNDLAIRAMTRDVAAHFAIDRRHVYAAGLSGGARVALQVAVNGYAKGVIACSAGFPAALSDIPDRVPFPIFGTAGKGDFNFRELKQLDADLDERKAAHRVVVFDGGHEWAPAALLMEAVAWLEMQAMRDGTRTRDEALIESVWRIRLNELTSQSGLDRWRELKSLAADFKGLRDTAALDEEVRKLGGAREVKDALKAERTRLTREGEYLDRLIGAGEKSAAARQKLVAEIRGKADALEDSPERQMLQRVLSNYSALVREQVPELFKAREYDQAANLLEVANALRPNQARTLFDLARARGYSRESQRALDALRQAAAAGFSDAARAESDPAFVSLKMNPAFAEALAAMRANPPRSEGRAGPP
jgi:poly(3-hydroxybutyrate) depolymerase